MRRPVALLAVLACVAASPVVLQAQPQSPRGTLEKLAADLEELREKTVQVPTLASAVEDLSVRLAALEQQLAVREREQQSIPDTLARVDALDPQIRALAAAIRALETRVADIEQPWSPEPAASAGGGVVHDGGFAWSTGDGKYALVLGGYFQIRHQTRLSDGVVDEATFRLRRARLGVSGHLGGGAVRYKILVSALDDPAALDYYLEHRYAKSLTVRLGQYKSQFTRNFTTSSTRLAFVERPRAIEAYRYDRDLQLGALGQLAGGRLGYYVGIGNGAGPNKLNDNIDIAATARLDAAVLGERFKYAYGDLGRTPSPALMVGLGVVHDLVAMPAEISGIAVNTDVDGDGERDNVHVVSASVDAIVRYRGWEASAEAVFRYESFGTILDHPENAELLDRVGLRDDRLYLGGFGQVTRALPWRLLAGARVGYSRQPFLGLGGRSSRIPTGDHLLEADGLVQLYDDHGSRRAGLLYTFHRYDGDAADEHRLIVEAQLTL